MRLAAFAVLLCGFLIEPAANSIHPFHGPSRDADLSSWRPAPTTLRGISFGFRAVASDFYWLSAIQYFGTAGNEQVWYRGLIPLLEAVTDLDPNFDYPYQFAGQCVPYHDPGGLWYNTGAAIDLVHKGVAVGVQRWQVPWVLGYLLYTYRGAYAEAGQSMAQAARLPGAPAYLGSLAARLLAQGDQLETAIEITRSALAEAPDERERSQIEERLEALILQQEIETLNTKLGARRAAGLAARTDEDLVEAAAPGGLPADPFGGKFFIDRDTGRVRSSSEDRLLRIHIHPGAPPIEKVFD